VKKRKRGEKKRYDSVTEMVRDTSEDPGFVESVVKQIDKRAVINCLMALRAAAGLSQTEIARKMKCTQSRISKLENGVDNDLRIGDFHAYAEALGLRLMILLGKKEKPPIAKRIKYHISALKDTFAELKELVGDDDAMKKAMWGHLFKNICVATEGVADLISHVTQRLRQEDVNAPSPIQIGMEDEETGTVCGTKRASTTGACDLIPTG
jgi:transcriptional regulator with XRE-family HTH domain